MKWTFGIITDGKNWDRVYDILGSIQRQSVSVEHQIIICGGEEWWGRRTPSTLYIPFDETQKEKGWITRKKNLIAQSAHHDNLCLMHDYVRLDPKWVEGFEKHGDDWLTCTNRIFNLDGSRFRDWCVIYNDAWMEPPIDDTPPPTGAGRLLYYGTRGYERWQYYSGAYFCTKTQVMLDVPLDENRIWGQGEDVQWCRLLYKKYGAKAFDLNMESKVHLLKQKERAPWEREMMPL
jgi:hypothetical protein